MISVHSALLVALGFLIASLIGVLMGSALWARAVRLTTMRIRQSMPVSEAEIKADRDRLRAEFALRVHKLEASLDEAKLERARQLIEINRRDAAIADMQAQASDLKGELEEHVNARRVLEQTVADRLPRVEARLAEAKRLLFNRDREIAELTTGAKRHQLALEEASSISAQQSAQIEKLTSALSTRGRGGPGDARFEGELVLRTEVETLRAKTREQATLIDRLQQRLGQQGYMQEAPAARVSETPAQVQETARLRQKLADAEAALAAVRAAGSDTDAARIAFESELRALNARAEDQAGEIARLNAALAVFDRYEGKSTPVRESKLLLKARLSSAHAHSDQQAATIGRLRAELAATHDRLARQAAHFMEEMRRVMHGQAPIAGPGPVRRRPARLTDASVAERVAQVRPASADYSTRNGAVQDLASQLKRAQGLVGKIQDAQQGEGEASPPAQHGANGTGPAAPAAPASAWAEPPENAVDVLSPADAPPATNEKVAVVAAAAELAQDLPQPASIVEERRRPRLLDRLSGLAKSQQG